jgi:WhiB family redox-sensing transcriptional regulator
MTARYWSDGAAGPILAAEDRRAQAWRDSAACGPDTADLFFGPAGEQTFAFEVRVTRAKLVCAGCPVKAKCLAAAMQAEVGHGALMRHGVFGGLTGPERAAADKGPRRARRSQPLPLLTDRQVERFQALLRPGGCGLTWAGPVYDGRLVFTAAASMTIGARRLAYALATGEDPGALPVRQRCGDPMCMTSECLTTDPLPARAA